MAIQIKNDNVLISHINDLQNSINSLDSRVTTTENKFAQYLPLTGVGLTGPLTSTSSLALGDSLTFNGVYNAIRYVGTSSTNSMIRFLDNASNGYGTGVSIGRAIFAIPGHATFGVFMGYWLSRAKTFWLDGKIIRMRICKLFSLAIPMLIHGAYDFLLSEQVAELGGQTLFYIYVILLDFFAWRVIKHEFRTDRML